jgi:hypothetical protein
MYFANFPTIVYDFNINGKTEYKIITDVTRNVRFRKKILENIALYDEYDIQEGETPEIISEKIYGTPFYHWVIMLVNQRYDYMNDFPITQRELDALVEEKYGEAKDHAKYYLYKDPISGLSVQKECPVTLVLKESNALGSSIGAINVGDVITVKDFGYKARVDQILVPSNGTNITIISSLRTGQFITGADTILFEDSTADLVSFSVPAQYSTVSNYQYEDIVNESKRRIKIVNATYIDQILKEFEDLL